MKQYSTKAVGSGTLFDFILIRLTSVITTSTKHCYYIVVAELGMRAPHFHIFSCHIPPWMACDA